MHPCLVYTVVYSPRLSRGSALLCLFILAGPVSHFIVANSLDASLTLLLGPSESKQMQVSLQGHIPETDVVATGGYFFLALAVITYKEELK